jgi:MinD-like ATPase involved in chromosome partitioning or flagellar assembly
MAKSIAVHSFKGGTGKSTITANLAAALVGRGRRVGIMDMDLEGPGLHVIFGLDPDDVRYTLNDVLLDAARPEQAAIDMNERLGLNGRGQLFFTPASIKVSEMLRTLRTGFEVESFSSAVSKLQDHFKLDYLLIDTHPGLENDTLLVMGVCDHLLIVSRIDQQDIFGTGVMVEIAGTLEKPAHLVVNMIPSGIKLSDASKLALNIGNSFKVEVMGWFPFSEDVQGSLSKSVFILTSPKHPIASRFQDLAKKVEAFS